MNSSNHPVIPRGSCRYLLRSPLHAVGECRTVDLLLNPYRGTGLPPEANLARGVVSANASEPIDLLTHCPLVATTPLRDMAGLVPILGIESLLLKDESRRMGLGSFKALGAAYVIAREAARRVNGGDGPPIVGSMSGALRNTVYACASAGNHGLSVAAGARLFGARAVIYLDDAVPESFADRLRALDAEVVRSGGDYADCMKAVAADAHENGWILLSDSSWPGYVDLPARVMEGYLVMGDEVVHELVRPPTHVFLQAGVGGLAAAMTALFRARWGDALTIVVVEPEAAPALIESIRAGAPVATSGPVSNMGRLDCKEPSHLALGELARGADWFLTIDDEQAAAAVELLACHGIATTASGAAGVAALQHAGDDGRQLGLSATSRVLAIVTEGREDAAILTPRGERAA